MKTSSCKAKARRLQNPVASDLLALAQKIDPSLDRSDIHPVTMGVPGKDIILTRQARKVVDVCVECKNQESLGVTTAFYKHYGKYADDKSLKLLVHCRNKSEALVTLKWADFLALMDKALHEC